MPTPTRRFLRTHVTWAQALIMFFVLLGANFVLERSTDSDLERYSDQNREEVTTALKGYADDNKLQNQQALIRVCEDQKLDRIDEARAWTQAEETWTAQANDRSLSHADRTRSHDTAIVYGESANQLRTRLLLCEPYVIDGEKIIDERALREAKGDL